MSRSDFPLGNRKASKWLHTRSIGKVAAGLGGFRTGKGKEPMASENVSPEQAEWAAQYEFWTKIISDEVARLRWNEGFEPLDAHLYELKASLRSGQYVGTVKICGRDFECTAYRAHDAEGNPTLKLSIRVKARKDH